MMIRIKKIWESKQKSRSIKEAEVMTSWMKRHKFDLFVHVTFPQGVREDRAVKWFKGFWKSLNIRHRQVFNDYVILWIFAEKNRSNAKYVHLHSFVQRVDPKHAPRIEKQLKSKIAWDFGGPGEIFFRTGIKPDVSAEDISRWRNRSKKIQVEVEPYNQAESGVFYCARKYTGSYWAEFERFVVRSRCHERSHDNR